MDAATRKACLHCGRDNPDDSRFCQHCGEPFADATVRWSGPPGGQGGEMHRMTPLDALFAVRTKLLIGRGPECDVCLAHPMVSRRHALLERQSEGLLLTDLGSVNGVTIAGRRIQEPTLVRERDQVGIGPFLFSVVGGVIYTVDSSRRLRLEAHHLEKKVSLQDGQTRKLLDNVNLVVEPGEFVGLLGPSGSGKSTLMDCLNGRRRATGGCVLANGEDFYRHFDTFRQSLGYVPQRDIVHTQLTVSRAFYYTARLRLPTDTGPTELMARIEEVLQQMELGPHRDTLVANLSGGQIKRVSLGAELLARPCLLYIDEATSGLDAGTEARMMRLFRQLAEESKSILCITHNVDNVDRCHLVLVLLRGKLVYYGPPREAPTYFGVAKLSEIYDRLAEKDVLAWEKSFVASSLHREFVAERLGSGPAETPAARTPPSGLVPIRAGADGSSASIVLAPGSAPTPQQRLPLWHQFRVLTARDAELTLGDRRSLRLLLLQAPIVALFLLAGFIGKAYEKKIPVPRELTENEVVVLEVAHGLDHALANDGTLDAEQEQRLASTQFTVQEQGLSRTVNGAQLVHLLRLLPRSDPPALERVQVTIQHGAETITRNARQLLELRDALHEAQLTDRLLRMHADGLPVVPDRDMVDPRFTYMLLFMLVIIVLWFGCNNAAKEIVKEEAIYGRERAVNLGILPYLSSKFLILSLITVGQATILMVMVYGTLEVLHTKAFGYEFPPAAYRLDYGQQWCVLSLLAMTGVALGLLLSACVSSPERASALLPYVLIPQIILGGGILPIKEGLLWWLAVGFSPVYWAFRAVHRGSSLLPSFIPYHQDYSDDAWLPCGVMVLELVLLLTATAWFLRQKDVNRA